MRLSKMVALGLLGGGSSTVVYPANSQSLSSELVVNGVNPIGFTADNPTGWTVTGEVGSDPAVHQVGAGEGHLGVGTGYINYYSSATNNDPTLAQTILSVGGYYEVKVNINTLVSGSLIVFDASAGISTTYTTTGQKYQIGRAANAILRVRPTAAPSDITIASVSAKAINLNTQQVAPSANMRVTQYFTPPASPDVGESIWVMPRISNFATGDYWLVYYRYSGTQWDINAYSVAAFTRTNRIAATNIGSANGIRINMNGNLIDLQTTADNGQNWTTRGSQINNSTFNTATGVNTMYTSTFTPGNLQYEPAA